MTTASSSTAGLGRRAARGAAVTFGAQALRIAIQVLSVTILARMLAPRDYGLLAMVVVIVGIGEIFRDFGLSSAAIQAKELSNAQRDNLFWINTAIGVLLGLAVAAGAGLIAQVYGRQELVGIARALAVTFVLNGLATQYRADLLRRMLFARVAAAGVAAPVVALVVAVGIALADGGYWALVAQNIAQSVALLVGMVIGGRWRPRRYRRSAPMRGLLTFGWRMVGTQLIGYAANNTDTLVIGLRFSPTSLGVYNRSFQLLMTPLSQLRAPTTTIALPVLSRLQDDARRYDDFIRRGQLALGYSLVAGLALVVATAEPVTALFLGDGWAAVVPLLRLLAVAGIFQTLAYVGYWVYLSRNLTADLLRYTMVTAVIKVACVLVGSHWGVVGVASGYAIAPAIEWPLSLWWLSRRTSFPGRALTIGALRILAVATVAGGSAALVSAALAGTSPILQLLAASVTAVVAYLLAAWLVPRVRADVRAVIEIARMTRQRAA